jgi:hypothetical protein
MMVRNRAHNITGWRYDELWLILLRQFKRLLGDQGVELTDAQMQALAVQMVQRSYPTEEITAVQVALTKIVEDSLTLLRGWQLTYAQSLATSMDAMPGWETTADFLELANEKGNAELRISAGASLLVGSGDARYADELLACYRHGMHDPEDVDAVIAHRALSFAAGIPDDDPDWLTKIDTWLKK